MKNLKAILTATEVRIPKAVIETKAIHLIVTKLTKNHFKAQIQTQTNK